MKSDAPISLVLSFESSCDETCAAVLRAEIDTKNREPKITVLSNIVASQIDIHKLYGGVVPEIASRNHAMAILGVCEEALRVANVTKTDITHVAATAVTGLRGAVMVGQVFGESLAHALKIPFIPVNHLCGHIASVRVQSATRVSQTLASPPVPPPEPVQPPFVSLLVSGGHTALYMVKRWDDVRVISQTLDDACGEAFDKVGKILGLEYPAGVKIQELGNEYARKPHADGFIQFVKNPTKSDNFSYSGLKTAVLNYVRRGVADVKMSRAELLRVAASFQHEAIMQLVTKSVGALKKYGAKTLCVCGGVSANTYLREKMTNAVGAISGRVIFPDFEYCTDNAAMIGAAAILGVAGAF